MSVNSVTSPEQVNFALLEQSAVDELASAAASTSVENRPQHVEDEKKATAVEEPFVYYPLADHSDHISFLEKVITEKPANTREITNIFYRMHGDDSHSPAIGCCGIRLGHDDLLHRVNTFLVQQHDLQQRHAMDPRVRIPLRHTLSLKNVITILAKEQLTVAKKANKVFKQEFGNLQNRVPNALHLAHDASHEVWFRDELDDLLWGDEELGIAAEEIGIQDDVADALLDGLIGDLVSELNRIQAVKEARAKERSVQSTPPLLADTPSPTSHCFATQSHTPEPTETDDAS